MLEFVGRERVEVLAVQETKLELVMGNLCVKLWGGLQKWSGLLFL